MPHTTLFVSAAAAFLLAAPVSAQLSLTFVQSFVDTFPGGQGNIGVTQDEATFDYYVIAFNNPQNVHVFNLVGAPQNTFASTPCSPSLPSPNDVTYDPFTQTLWFVDNNGGNVLNMSRQGTCLSGWPLPVSVVNPVGICFDRNSRTLFVSHTGAVLHLSLSGSLLPTGFPFAPPSGSQILSGITYVPSSDRFLISQSGGTQIYEVDRTGLLISTTPMASFGIVNIQGLHYNPALQQLAVVDNSLSTTFVFSLPLCAGTIVHRAGIGCVDGGGQVVVLGATGCANLGGNVTFQSLASPNPLPMLFAGGSSDTSAGVVPLPLDLGLLGAPGCWLYTSSEAVVTAPQVGNSAVLPFAIPNNPLLSGAQLFLQAVKLDVALTTPLPLATSNYLHMTVY